jgi:hypothetical protein
MARNWELVGAVPTLCATGSGMVEISQSIMIAMSAMGPRENGGTRVLEHAVDMQVRKWKNWTDREPNMRGCNDTILSSHNRRRSF